MNSQIGPMEFPMILMVNLVSWMFLHVPFTATQSLRDTSTDFKAGLRGPQHRWLRRTASEDQLAPGPGRTALKVQGHG